MEIVKRTRQARILHELIEDRGFAPKRYALFFVSGEGIEMPWKDDEGYPMEETSGHLIDEKGRVFAFWMAWDTDRKGPAIVEWEEQKPDPNWLRSPEYRAARVSVGLPV